MRPFILLFVCSLILWVACDPPEGSSEPPEGSSEPPEGSSEPGGRASDLAPPPENLRDLLQTAGFLPSESQGSKLEKIRIIYVTPDGGSAVKDGSSWENAHAAAELKTAIDNAGTAANEQKPYLVMVAAGSYAISETLNMKNYVAIMGGFSGSGWDRGGTTTLDGKDRKRVFDNKDLDHTAVLFGVTISNGYVSSRHLGGGMFNTNSSPGISDVIFSKNTAYRGGGMYNDSSSPTLNNVVFSKNTAAGSRSSGGGMLNDAGSCPALSDVTFSGNTADDSGGGMTNWGSSPTLSNVTFSENTAFWGAGMWNRSSSPRLSDVTFSKNSATNGGGMYNNASSSPDLNNVTFRENTADSGGGIYNYDYSSPTLTDVAFSGNTANDSGGGLLNKANSSPTLNNVTFSGNTAPTGPDKHEA